MVTFGEFKIDFKHLFKLIYLKNCFGELNFLLDESHQFDDRQEPARSSEPWSTEPCCTEIPSVMSRCFKGQLQAKFVATMLWLPTWPIGKAWDETFT